MSDRTPHVGWSRGRFREDMALGWVAWYARSMRFMVAALALVVAAPLGCRPAESPSSPAADLEAAKALFQRNIEAIRNKDREAYLACYRDDEGLIRAGDEGVHLGFEPLASGTSTRAEDWPSRIEATDLEVHPVAPGVVYGMYRYEVVIDGKTRKGRSERVFLQTPKGWRIAITTAFDD